MQLYQLLFPNGKKYIGITSKTAEERFKEHCCLAHNKGMCQKAIHKYGKENVIIKVLATVDNWELLCLAEIEAIEKYKTRPPNGYNLTLGGEGVVGNVLSIESRLKMSESGKRRPKMSSETRKKLSISSTGRKVSAEHKEILRMLRTGKPLPREQVEKMRLAKIGKPMSEETKRKISIANKRNGISVEHLRKMFLAKKKGFRHSAESLDKMSKAHAGKKLSQEHKDKIGESSRGRTHSKETKEKMSLIAKNRSKEHLAKIALANTGRIFSEETRKKQSLAQMGKKIPPEVTAKRIATLKRNKLLKLCKNPV